MQETILNDVLLQAIQKDGFIIMENVLDDELLKRLRLDLEKAIKLETAYHDTENHRDFGMVMFCPIYGKSFIDLIMSESYLAPVEKIMGKNCIVYSYTSSSMPPNLGNYATRIHNDCEHIIPEGYINRFQALIALDDFTLENGATYVLPGSHRMNEAPSEEMFYKNAIRLTMKAGSIWYAHARLWHAGGINTTDKWRHGLTTVFCKAYMKQRVDIPRILEAQGIKDIPSRAQQKFGFLAQVPASYEEFYAPYEQRKFKQPLE